MFQNENLKARGFFRKVVLFLVFLASIVNLCYTIDQMISAAIDVEFNDIGRSTTTQKEAERMKLISYFMQDTLCFKQKTIQVAVATQLPPSVISILLSAK